MIFIKKKLFGKNIEPQCAYCEWGKASKDGSKVICGYNGVVAPEYSCRKYEYSPLKRKPKAAPSLPEYNIEDFKL